MIQYLICLIIMIVGAYFMILFQKKDIPDLGCISFAFLLLGLILLLVRFFNSGDAIKIFIEIKNLFVWIIG